MEAIANAAQVVSGAHTFIGREMARVAKAAAAMALPDSFLRDAAALKNALGVDSSFARMVNEAASAQRNLLGYSSTTKAMAAYANQAHAFQSALGFDPALGRVFEEIAAAHRCQTQGIQSALEGLHSALEACGGTAWTDKALSLHALESIGREFSEQLKETLGSLRAAAATFGDTISWDSDARSIAMQVDSLNQLAFAGFANGWLTDVPDDPLTVKAHLDIVAAASHLLEGPDLSRALPVDWVDAEHNDSPGDDLLASWVPNTFVALEHGLRRIEPSILIRGPKRAVGRSLSRKVKKAGEFLVDLVLELNELAELKSGGSCIFKPTNRTMRACKLLPLTVAEDREGFAVVVDYLYFLIYEGSGSMARVIERLGQPASEPLFMVKHLRSFVRHDQNHGSEKGYAKQLAQTSKSFQVLIQRPLPASSRDWSHAQLRLYRVVCDALSSMLARERTAP